MGEAKGRRRPLFWLSCLVGLAVCAALGYVVFNMWLENQMNQNAEAAKWKIELAYDKAHPRAIHPPRLPNLEAWRWAEAEVPELHSVWLWNRSQAETMRKRIRRSGRFIASVLAVYAVLATGCLAASSARTRSRRAGAVLLMLSATPLAVYAVRRWDDLIGLRHFARSLDGQAFAVLAGLALLLLFGIPQRILGWIAGGERG